MCYCSAVRWTDCRPLALQWSLSCVVRLHSSTHQDAASSANRCCATLQAGVSTLLILCTFSAPAVWQLHEYDPILANPVLVLVLANLSLLFTVRCN